ncbi:hypothetical protein PPERSA_04618 [Pseudocohnilembus persalinus]|uniref:EF-hand domain-containing protein n=1 Tax=Pseudocohnilembus persalinus TaxID=266149 RepID=A0A0V0QNC8_PSEPJ|nr:hypothetical protein PPERSA_04618 [Pseudocohnilembus persalinus]|eukprot:KRX03823.1 hypothetical protein PPERSA_04618 [Pseudocohnilembus persalinus]
MTKYDFDQFLRKIGIFLSTQELRCLIDHYGIPGPQNPNNQLVKYNEIIDLIKVDMSEYRLKLVKTAFQFINTENQEKIPLQTLYKRYIAREHPRARTLMKTTEQVQEEFEREITKKSSDGKNITEQEFLSYYADLNLTHSQEKDEYFADMILRTWGVTTGENYVSPERLADLELILYEKIRQRTQPKKNEGLKIYQTFRYFDLDDTGVVDYPQFVKACQEYGCNFEEKELVALYNKYEHNDQGQIIFKKFAAYFADLGSGRYPNLNPIFEEMSKYPATVIEKIKSILQQKQISQDKIFEDFAKSDYYNNGALTREQFQSVIQSYGIILSKPENDSIYRHFDPQFQDQINYHEFVKNL